MFAPPESAADVVCAPGAVPVALAEAGHQGGGQQGQRAGDRNRDNADSAYASSIQRRR